MIEWIDPPAEQGFRAPEGVAPLPPVDTTGVVESAFRQDNTVVSLYRRLRQETFPAEPNYNPLPEIQGTKYFQNHADNFLASQSSAETRAIMRRIDQEDEDRKVLHAAGWGGTLAQLMAGVADPIMWFVPGGEIAMGARGAANLGRTAVRTGAGFAAQAGVSEAALQATQETRTAAESAAAVGTATLLGAILGPAFSRLGPADRRMLEASLEADRRAMAAHATGVVEETPRPSGAPPLVPDPVGPGWAGGDAGAAMVEKRQLNLQGYGLNEIPVLGRLVERSAPTLNNLSAQSITARRATADLAETPFRFQGDEAPTIGPALERIARMEIDRARVGMADELDRLYGEYRFADQKVSLPRLRDQFERMTGAKADGYLSYSEFKTEVSKALQQSDKHDIPQVAQAAQQIRGQVFDRWHQRAIEAGLLTDGLPKGAESYFHRVWNKETIKAQRPKFLDRVTGYLKADQATKAGIKDRLGALSERLKEAANRIAKATDEESSVAAQKAHNDIRLQIEKEIASWEGGSAAEAKAALKAREKYRAGREAKASAEGKQAPTDRLKAADEAVDRAVAKILLSDRNLADVELRTRADEIADRILGSPDGRLPYEMSTGARQVGPGETARGALAARRFAIPDHLIADFLETDVEKVVSDHLRTMVPDVLLTEKFGDVEMSDVFRKINAEYAGLIENAKSESARVKLRKEQEGVIARLAGMRDRIRGVYGFNPNAVMQGAARAVGFAKNVNLLTSGGSFALTSMVDMAGSIFRYGLGTVMQDAWVPFLRAMTGGGDEWKQAARQYKAMGIANELALATRSRAITDITDLYRPQSRVERGLQWGADKYMVANLLAPWTDWGKINASIVAGNEILRASKAVANGTATKKQIAQLAESGIPDWLAPRIWQEFSAEGSGEIVNGVHLPNTDRWKNSQARQAFEGAVGREADIAIITPGQEKPLWMSDPVLSVFGQFKSFMAASTQRLLIANLQRADAQVLQGLIFSIGMGMLSYKLNAMAGGTPVSDRPQDWIKEGISRSGVLGWFEEGNAMASKMTRGGVDVYRLIGADKPLSRYASRSALDSILGPTAGKIGSVLQVTGSAATGDWTQNDTKALRRLIATQNLFYIRGLWDQVEAGFNQALDVPEKRERQ
jgi:hypothetical protein